MNERKGMKFSGFYPQSKTKARVAKKHRAIWEKQEDKDMRKLHGDHRRWWFAGRAR